MRYAKGQKDETKQRIKSTAAALLRRDGITATGIAGLMNECGLTNGAFYGHFESKDELVRDALELAQEQRLQALQAGLDSAAAGGVEAAIRDYLSAAHVHDAACGCPSAALASEVARASGDVREAYTAGLSRLLDRIEAELPPAARDSAPALFAMLVGCVQLARASNDEALSGRILASGLATALALYKAASAA